jgi:hypothetical protein
MTYQPIKVHISNLMTSRLICHERHIFWNLPRIKWNDMKSNQMKWNQMKWNRVFSIACMKWLINWTNRSFQAPNDHRLKGW